MKKGVSQQGASFEKGMSREKMLCFVCRRMSGSRRPKKHLVHQKEKRVNLDGAIMKSQITSL